MSGVKNIQKHREMKKTIFFWIALFVFLASNAADTLMVKEPQVPILIDRQDNVLMYLRIDANKVSSLSELTFTLDKSVNLSEIKSLKLYYGGTEAVAKSDKILFAPVSYISSFNAGKTRTANPSYSVKVKEIDAIKRSIVFSTPYKLFPGINYFWVSIEMKPATNLLSTIQISDIAAKFNNKTIPLTRVGNSVVRRMGFGVRQAGDDGVAAYRIPGLVTSKKGTLLGVYDVRHNNSVDLQEYVDIGLSRSFDKGQTWQPMQIPMAFGEYGGLPKAQNGVGDPSILVDDKTGAIWIIAAWTHGMGNERAWFNSQAGMDMNHTAQLMLVKSEDDGKTWSKPINITEQVKHPSWKFLLQGPGRGITMQDGTLVFPIQFIDSLKMPHAGVMYSKDRGVNWTIHAPARENTTEAQVAEIEPSVLMLNMRDNRGGSRAVMTTTDLGKTWTDHSSTRSVLPEPVCMASLLQIQAKDNVLGRDILLFSNPNSTSARNHITIKASLDKGKTFPQEYQIMLDEESGWGYTCLTQIDKETIGILYESSVAHMTFQKFKLTDLIRN